MTMLDYRIDEWFPQHPRWPDLETYAHQNDLVHGVINEDGLTPTSHFLVALVADETGEDVAGLLMFLVQPIGPEMDCPILVDSNGNELTEAKIRAFHVDTPHRRRGIGTTLQRATLEKAANLGCFQVRSRSASSRDANYAIKIKLGFACHPAIRQLRSGDETGVYWVKRADTNG
jgi:GNAT superfamily N-acetyltransferase